MPDDASSPDSNWDISDFLDYSELSEDGNPLLTPLHETSYDLSLSESILNDSRITPTGNGDPNDKPYCTPPTSGQKWWAAVLLGFVFLIISSSAAYYATSAVTTYLGGAPTLFGSGPTISGLVLHTIIFILVVRAILW
jgi:hypothetical protein